MKEKRLFCVTLFLVLISISKLLPQQTHPSAEIRIGDDGHVQVVEHFSQDNSMQEVEQGESSWVFTQIQPVSSQPQTTSQGTEPDLVVSSVTVVDSEGPEISYYFSISNTGDVACNASSARICLSFDLIFRNDVIIDTKSVPGIPAHSSYNMLSPTTTNIGCHVDPENYYLYVIADIYNDIAEANEDNNIGYDDSPQVHVSSHIDLLPGKITIVSYDLNTFQMAYWIDIYNFGNTDSGFFETDVYLSTNNIITTSDYRIDDFSIINLASCGSFADNEIVGDDDALKGLLPGDYYLGCIIDAGYDVSESNELNNTAYDTYFMVNIPSYVDLYVSDISVTDNDGPDISFEYTIENRGDLPAGSHKEYIYLQSNGSRYNIYEESFTVDAFGSVMSVVNMTVSGIPGGEYSLGVFADAEDDIDEYVEDNNKKLFVYPKINIPATDLPNAPVLIVPSNGAMNVSINPKLQWQHGGGGTPDYYKIEVRDEFGTLVVSANSSNAHETVGPLSYNTTYTWHVQAVNSYGSSPWSDSWTFTTEGGSGPIDKSWYEQITDDGRMLYSVDAVSEHIGWTCGRNTALFRTTDGGENWTDAAGNSPGHRFYSIDALDEYTAVATGYNFDFDLYDIQKTVDGGNTWTQTYSQDGPIRHIHMFDALNGRAVGDPVNGAWTVLETSDGGDSWSMMPTCPSAIEGDFGYYCGVNWYSSDAGWFGTNSSKAYHTPDRGNQWLNVVIPELPRVTSIAFEPSGNVGIGCSGSDSQMARTNDGGTSWENIAVPQQGTIYNMHHADGGFWTLINWDIWMSNNLGDTWEHETTAPRYLRDISFYGSNENRTGWAVGNRGIIMRYGTETTGIEQHDAYNRPEMISLLQNYPNPFNAETTIIFDLEKPGFVDLKILDIQGKEIASLISEFKEAGSYQFTWDAGELPSGIYLYRLQTDSHIETRKLIMQK